MKVLVFTTAYPNEQQPNLGVFVRERMSRVAEYCEIKVVAPVPFFPGAGFLKKKYRARPPYREFQEGIEILHPRFFLIPRFCKGLDGVFLFLSSLWTVFGLRRRFDFDLIDAHFAYPDGFAAILLGRAVRRPVTITLRGTINRLIHYPVRGMLLKWALKRADRVFSVSRYLIDLALENGADLTEDRVRVIPNGVDTEKFSLLDKISCRKDLDLPLEAPVIVSVGGLVERKGHHRVMEILPALLEAYPDLHYLVVGGGSVEGDMTGQLRELAARSGITDHVHFAGEIDHSEVKKYLCAADVFVLPTRFEGWANVFFEAMACGLPVVTTRVCGNAEVVKEGRSGLLVSFGDPDALQLALRKALAHDWDRESIISYAYERPWSQVAREVHQAFADVLQNRG